MTLNARLTKLSRIASCTALILPVAACGGSAAESTGPHNESNPYGITATGPGILSVSPLNTGTLIAATPLGAMAPPGHVLPTDHVYLYFVDAWNGHQQDNDCSIRPVRAAGSGVVTFVYQTDPSVTDTKIEVQMTQTFHYYYDHVALKPGIAVGTHVNAGDTIATTTGRCPSMDLGVIDDDVSPAGFVNAARYGRSTGHAVSPYKYFNEPLRTFMYSRVRLIEGVPANKDGRTDWGVRGKLVGDWFHLSLANETSGNLMGPLGWPKTISFAYDWFDNTQVRISIGGTITDAGLLRVAPTDPNPSTITVADGVVAHQGTPTLGRISAGWLLVQMLTDERMKVQYFAGATTRRSAFTSAAEEYVR